MVNPATSYRQQLVQFGNDKWLQTQAICTRAKNWVVSTARSHKKPILKIWNNSIAKVLPDNWSARAKRMNSKDVVILSGGAVTGYISGGMIVRRCGREIAPIACCVGLGVFLGSASWMYSRVISRINRKATAHFREIRKKVLIITPNTNVKEFVEIDKIFVKLRKPKYSHLEEVLKPIDDEVKKFYELIKKIGNVNKNPDFKIDQANLISHIDEFAKKNLHKDISKLPDYLNIPID